MTQVLNMSASSGFVCATLIEVYDLQPCGVCFLNPDLSALDAHIPSTLPRISVLSHHVRTLALLHSSARVLTKLAVGLRVSGKSVAHMPSWALTDHALHSVDQFKSISLWLACHREAQRPTHHLVGS